MPITSKTPAAQPRSQGLSPRRRRRRGLVEGAPDAAQVVAIESPLRRADSPWVGDDAKPGGNGLGQVGEEESGVRGQESAVRSQGSGVRNTRHAVLLAVYS